MRISLALALMASLTLPVLATAQNLPDRGPAFGPRATSGANGTDNGGATGGTIPPAAARQQQSGGALAAIPEHQALATIQDKCGGAVSNLWLDSHSVWHARCGKTGQTLALGPDGNVTNR